MNIHKFVHITSISWLMFLGLIWVCGCSKQDMRSDPKALSRQLARAAQGMTASARLGAMMVTDAQYEEREPNPNAYVGKQVYRRYCESCHGASRRAPDIIENRVTPSDPESDYYIILYGLTEMPAFRTRLTKFQIYDILKYMDPEFTRLKQLDSNSESSD